jgi:putative sulfotransferase
LFHWLARRFGRAAWIERSGGSLRVVARLARLFPTARFVHIVRDGQTTALSMSRHLGFRLALVAMQLTEILGRDPFESPDRRGLGDVPDELVPLLPEAFDRDAFLAYDTPAVLCGHYWSGEIVAGMRELAALPPERVLVVRYEDLLAAPEDALARLLAFVDPAFVDRPWIVRAARTIRPPRSTLASLSRAERAALDDACAPGLAELGSAMPR